MHDEWSPGSWRRKPLAQPIDYPDRNQLEDAIRRLSRFPPLVTSWEIETLKSRLAEAAHGERFLLQGGDCAETFEDCCSSIIANKLKILLKMSLVLMFGGKMRIIRVGRMAGQYAKPRSQLEETRGNTTLPTYRGAMINRPEFSPEARTPDPELMIQAYLHAALTLNFVRSLIHGGFADLRHPEFWDLRFVDFSSRSHEYRRMLKEIGGAVSFLEAVAERSLAELGKAEFFTSHEGLHLWYEQAQTRRVPRRSGWYDLSTHFPWIGDRTREIGGAHVEYFRGIANPVAVKIGRSCSPHELLELVRVLNPDNVPGKLTVIHRFGADRIAECLPPLVEMLKRHDRRVVWCCDPMHGNTISLGDGLKTRRFDDILREVVQAFAIHHAMGGRLNGVHFELTGEDVTECIGGARGTNEADLRRAYQSQVDPRLNYEQAMEMALLIARCMRGETVS
ncbi:3-deoxy-7-phosphoheptulonate synthase class II [Thermopirellula anaerolimosa]